LPLGRERSELRFATAHFIGADLNLLFRMLEARPFKYALATSGADLALITSQYVYETVIVRRPSLTHQAAFQPLNVLVKGTRARASMHAPKPQPRPSVGSRGASRDRQGNSA